MRCWYCGNELTTADPDHICYSCKQKLRQQEIKTPHKCPVCDGTGLVSRPPHIPGDIQEWVDSSGGPYTCKTCSGSGVIWSP